MSKAGGFINIRLDTKQLRRDLAELKGRNVPRAMCNVVNRLAYNSRLKLQDEMKAKFKNPTPWTLGMFAMIPAKPGQARAAIVTKDLTSSYKGGTAAARYLSPEVFGGERELKPSEKKLSIISEGQEWVPGRDAPLNSYGNIKLSEIKKILDEIPNIGKRQNGPRIKYMKGGPRPKDQYFVLRKSENGKPMGVYKRVGKSRKFKEILRFIPTNAHYRPILPAQKIVDDLIAGRARRYVDEELVKSAQKRFSGKN